MNSYTFIVFAPESRVGPQMLRDPRETSANALLGTLRGNYCFNVKISKIYKRTVSFFFIYTLIFIRQK
jgi:hypothetical protein